MLNTSLQIEYWYKASCIYNCNVRSA